MKVILLFENTEQCDISGMINLEQDSFHSVPIQYSDNLHQGC